MNYLQVPIAPSILSVLQHDGLHKISELSPLNLTEINARVCMKEAN